MKWKDSRDGCMEDRVEGIGKGERVLQRTETLSICTKSCVGKTISWVINHSFQCQCKKWICNGGVGRMEEWSSEYPVERGWVMQMSKSWRTAGSHVSVYDLYLHLRACCCLESILPLEGHSWFWVLLQLLVKLMSVALVTAKIHVNCVAYAVA